MEKLFIFNCRSEVIMRVLNVEDDPFKHQDIKRALNIPEVLGCVHYSKNTDLWEEFNKLIVL